MHIKITHDAEQGIFVVEYDAIFVIVGLCNGTGAHVSHLVIHKVSDDI